MGTGRPHAYDVTITWTGNTGGGTRAYAGYARDHDVAVTEGRAIDRHGRGVPGPPTIPGSADPAFRGDPARWNPEQLFVAALSQCHMLWYLALAAQSGVVVTAYVDDAHGVMVEEEDGAGQFVSVVLRPVVTLAVGSSDEQRGLALALHTKAHEMCFIARSVSCPVHHEPTIT